MAEPLKNHFGPDVVRRIADRLEPAFPMFDREAFLDLVLGGFEELELTPRARRVSDALGATLPSDREVAIAGIVESLGPPIAGAELTGMDAFFYLPFVYFAADHGLENFEASMHLQYELTKRFTAEFSIRAFIERYPDETLARLGEWATDPNVHVRRLVSEGTRPRLPWAPRLRGFQADPTPVLGLLELLKDDPEEYVRRSVANNLNDISKDHPDVVVAVAQAWWANGGPERRRLVRHALRTLVKSAHEGALRVLGYGRDSPADLASVTVEPSVVTIGSKIRVAVVVRNPSVADARALADLRIHFVKASGATAPKVFKGAELEMEPGADARFTRTISLAQHSTRKHYPGLHRVEVILNGNTHAGPTFEVVEA